MAEIEILSEPILIYNGFITSVLNYPSTAKRTGSVVIYDAKSGKGELTLRKLSSNIFWEVSPNSPLSRYFVGSQCIDKFSLPNAMIQMIVR